jgi:hypothetical protein
MSERDSRQEQTRFRHTNLYLAQMRSPQRQADALAIALESAQSRFPACGGIMFWMGHDTFPARPTSPSSTLTAIQKPPRLALRRFP